jgi:hypothetical protein
MEISNTHPRKSGRLTAGVLEMSNTQYMNTISVYTVPVGQRLMIEQFSTRILLPRDQVVMMKLKTKAGGIWADHIQPLQIIPHISSSDIHQASNPIRTFADPGTTVQVSLCRSTQIRATDKTDFVMVSGYLVDVQ